MSILTPEEFAESQHERWRLDNNIGGAYLSEMPFFHRMAYIALAKAFLECKKQLSSIENMDIS